VNFVAVKMLTGDRTKYVGLIFAISVPSMLMAHQASIFARRRDLGHGPDAPSATSRRMAMVTSSVLGQARIPRPRSPAE